MLDPTLARTFVGRIVFAAMCDKLFDIDEKLAIVPQLATGYEWSADNKTLTIKLRTDVTFHDGEKLDAAAVKFNIERHKTMAGSNRSGELRPVTSVDVVDPATVQAQPLGAVHADPRRARRPRRHDGLAQGGEGRGRELRRASGVRRAVQVRRPRRPGQDHVRALSELLEQGQRPLRQDRLHADHRRRPCASPTCARASSTSSSASRRRTSTRSSSDKNLKVARITEIGYQGITINVGKSEQAQKNPLGKDAKVREAFELSLDRAGIVQVVMDNEATVGNQWVAPSNAFYAKNVPVPKRDIARAKALLKEAGVPNPTFTLVTPTTSDAQRLALVVQAMTKEAGFNVKIQSTEFATSLNMADKGDFEAYVLAWSGRADPDGNLYSFDACKQPLNYAGYCVPEIDELLERLAQPARPGRSQEDLRADRRARAEGPSDRLPLPPQLALGLQRQARRRAQRARRAAAGRGAEVDAVTAARRRALAPTRASGRTPMFEFLIKRLATIAPTLVFVSMLIFGLQQLLPGDPAVILAGEERDPNVVAYLHAKLHLDDPLPVRYGHWVARRGARRSRRVGAHAAAGARPDRAEAAGDDRARRARDDDRARDRHSRRHRLGGAARRRVGPRGQRDRALGPVDAELLARHPHDPAVLGAARLAAGVGLRQPVREPARTTSPR